MELAECQSSSGYAFGPPWFFKGSALYQLHLVKAETARVFIPKEFRLVEAFGYTLGGLFLAHYDDSPAGIFDELVVIAGIVWNPPTSCAWAARVLVNSHEACKHGRKEIGLPSHCAIFSKGATGNSEKPISKYTGLLSVIGLDSAFCKSSDHTEIQVTEIKGSAATALCNITLPSAVLEPKSDRRWMGPMIKMSLPSFSGKTKDNPELLKYSCQIECRVRAVEPAKVSGPTKKNRDRWSNCQNSDAGDMDVAASAEDDALNHSITVLLSKPILALKFNLLKMRVEAPTIVAPHFKKRTMGD